MSDGIGTAKVIVVMGAAVDSHELRLLFWETTAGCNLECIHCRRLDVSQQLMKTDMTTEQAFTFVSQLAAFAKPILVLSGGEPLFRPDIFKIATHARDQGSTRRAGDQRHAHR